MFLIITLSEKQKLSLFKKKYKLEHINKAEVSYSKLELKNKGVLNDKKLLALIKKTPIILSNELLSGFDKDNSSLNLVDDNEYSLCLFTNAIKQIFSNIKPQDKRKPVVLIDLKCKYQKLADILLSNFSTLKIITTKKELYQNYASFKLYECGVAVIIEENLDKLDKSALYISPSGIIFDKINSSEVVIFSIKDIKNAKAKVIHSFRAKTSQQYISLVEPDIDEQLLQAALYSHSNKRQLGKAFPDSFIFCGQKSRQFTV